MARLLQDRKPSRMKRICPEYRARTHRDGAIFPAHSRSVFVLSSAILAVVFAGASHCLGDEFSITTDSTVIGQNYGYPSGTPSQGRTPVGQVDLVTESAVFIENLELTGLDDHGIDGETFTGFLLPLRARYRAHERLSVELGAILGHNFGDENTLDVAEPLVRLAYEPRDNLYVIAGTMLPTHWIHDAIYDDVNKFRTGVEQGFQFRADRDTFKQDLWISWRVREGQVAPEEFDVANTMQWRMSEDALWLDTQVLCSHVGGQRSASPRVGNNVTLLGGASYGFANPMGNTSIDELRLCARYLFSSDDTEQTSGVTGSGYEVCAWVDMHPDDGVLLRLHGSYFEGDDLLARRGDPLYRLDRYGQVGAAALFDVAEDLCIETSGVAQLTEDRFNYTFMLNFIWGHAFAIDFVGPR